MLALLPEDGAAVWQRWSPLLDAALNGDREALAVVPEELVSAARDCGVLSFAQSADAASRFVADCLAASVLGAARMELWNVKEGHTSSVWRLTAHRPGAPPVRLAINVARDDAAGEELERSARELGRLATVASAVTVAAVVASGRVDLPGAPVVRPAVVAQDWIEDAAELAFLRSRDGGRRLYAVERWINSADEPGRITGAEGHPLDAAEHVEAARRATRFLLEAVRPADGDALRFPRIDVEHGDWMWAPERIYVVATAGELEVVPRARVHEHLRRVWTRGVGDADPVAGALLHLGADAALRDACAASDRGAQLLGERGA